MSNKQRQIQRRKNLAEAIEYVNEEGLDVMMFTDIHWRMDNIDWWPSAMKVHTKSDRKTYVYKTLEEGIALIKYLSIKTKNDKMPQYRQGNIIQL